MGSSLRAFSKMKTIISLIFVLGTVSCHGSYYRSVYSPYYRTRQYSTYRRSYSPLYSPPVVSPSLRTTSNQDDSTHPGTAASLAYMEASPSDSPCYVSGKEYIQASLSGSTPTEANLAATKAFASQISNLAKQGVTDIDLTCLESTKAWAASSDIPSSANAAAMMAFIQESLQTGTPAYDPVCAAALDAYIESYLGGASEEKANEAAGKAFVSAVDANPSFKMDSHCGKAAQAFMANF